MAVCAAAEPWIGWLPTPQHRSPLPEAMLAGRWKSPTMPVRYARSELAGRGAVARLRPEADLD